MSLRLTKTCRGEVTGYLGHSGQWFCSKYSVGFEKEISHRATHGHHGEKGHWWTVSGPQGPEGIQCIIFPDPPMSGELCFTPSSSSPVTKLRAGTSGLIM